MPTFDFECTYCGHEWRRDAFKTETICCVKCNDRNVKRRLHEQGFSNPFGYEDEPKKEPADEKPFWMMDWGND